MAIASTIKDLNTIQTIRKQSKIQDELWQVDIEKIIAATEKNERVEQKVLTAAHNWFLRKEPCAFLKDGRCTIYPIRPTACATYFVVDRCAPGIGSTDIVGMVDTNEVMEKVVQFTNLWLGFWSKGPELVHPLPLACAVVFGLDLMQYGTNLFEALVQTCGQDMF